jgi:large subunit ribosomal protein L24e
MAICSFCGSEVKLGTGKIFVYDNGTVLNFCSSKCQKNMLDLKRDPRKFKWTASYVKGGLKKADEK